jgi:hypothetical protein
MKDLVGSRFKINRFDVCGGLLLRDFLNFERRSDQDRLSSPNRCSPRPSGNEKSVSSPKQLRIMRTNFSQKTKGSFSQMSLADYDRF